MQVKNQESLSLLMPVSRVGQKLFSFCFIAGLLLANPAQIVKSQTYELDKSLAFLTRSGAGSKPDAAQKSGPRMPEQQLAKYVVEHLDISGFMSMLGFGAANDRSAVFAQYGYFPSVIDESHAILESANTKSAPRLEFQILNHNKSKITVYVRVNSTNNKSYLESIMLLHYKPADGSLQADRSAWTAIRL